jgi:diketogulonate reductase-like aldo/keto reductase
MRTVRTRDGAELPALGQGTWMMGESAKHRGDEIAALALGIDLGMTLIDTAEMYADGGAEEIVAEAIDGRRDDIFLVSKVLPHNASLDGTLRAAERSLKRLRTDRLDLYLLHWPGSHPLADTFEAFERLVEQGKILHYGVSNFDVGEMESVETLPQGARAGANQVLYNLERRGVERNLFPWCRERGVAIMAYSPLEQGRLRDRRALEVVAARHGATVEQIAVAWTLRLPDVVSIPKASRPEHVHANAGSIEVELTAEDLALLDEAYPPPERDVPLQTL